MVGRWGAGGFLPVFWLVVAGGMLGGCAMDSAEQTPALQLAAGPAGGASTTLVLPDAIAMQSEAPVITNSIVKRQGETQPGGNGGVYKIGKPYEVGGRWYHPRAEPDYEAVGIASHYGRSLNGTKTANGERYDETALSAAHTTLPLPSYVEVTNLANNRKVLVRVNDRGPFVPGRIVDLSWRAAEVLGIAGKGLGQVRVKYVGPAPLDGGTAREAAFLAEQQSTKQAGNN